jgi:phosphoribosylformylglycinamidine cyclo-ligase
LGGETADVGDVVRTIAVNGTMTVRWPKDKIVTNEKIKPGNVIIGLASYGRAIYETEYNSGIGSNGLTSARHDVLSKYYAGNYKESYDNGLQDEVVYIGKNKLTDNISMGGTGIPVGKLLLSPTRTYAPVMRELLQDHFEKINGLIHCSGGGQTKCLKYLPGNFSIIKDNLFTAPEIFQLIQAGSGASFKEMYEVFNMGCRMEIYCEEGDAAVLMGVVSKYQIDAQIIGRVEAGYQKELTIQVQDETLTYS